MGRWGVRGDRPAMDDSALNLRTSPYVLCIAQQSWRSSPAVLQYQSSRTVRGPERGARGMDPGLGGDGSGGGARGPGASVRENALP